MQLLREDHEASMTALRAVLENGGIRFRTPSHFGLDMHCPEITYTADLAEGETIRLRLYGEGYGRPTTWAQDDVDTTHHILALGVFGPESNGRESDGFLFGAWIVDDEVTVRMGGEGKENDLRFTDGPIHAFMLALRDQANKARYKSFEPVLEAPTAGPRP